MKRSLAALIAIVGAGSLAVTGAGLTQPTSDDLALLFMLMGLGILAERYAVGLFDSHVSVGVATVLIAAAVSGLWGVALVAPVVVLGGELRTTAAWYKRVYNAAAYVLAGAAYAGVFHGLGADARPDEWPGVLGVALLASAASFSVNSGLVAAAVGVHTGRSIMETWKEQYGWILPQSLIVGLSAMAAATVYYVLGLWGLAVFALPVAGVRRAYQVGHRAGEATPAQVHRAA